VNLFFDIETIPQQPEAEAKKLIAETIEAPSTMKKADTIADWHSGAGKYAGAKDAAIEEAYRKTALDGAKGGIISIAWAVGNGETASFSRAINQSESGFIQDALILIETHFSINKISANTAYFIGHNIPFDLKFLFHRCVVLGIKPPFKLPFSGRHKSDYFDNMQAWAGYNQRISQDNLCKALGIEGKPDDICGSKVWDYAKEGRIAEIEEYNRDDVNKVKAIYNRINFLTEG
tara:strand:+ start:1700 stop:2398 length:699 start_codon:yes stop_codon:yes gene_type:complete